MNYEVLRRSWSLAKPYKKRIFGASVCIVGFIICNALPAVYIKDIVDNLSDFKGGGSDNYNLMFFYVVLVVLAMFKAIFAYGQGYLLQSVGQSIITDLREELYQKIVILPVSFFDRSTTGDIVSRFSNGIGALSNFISVSIVNCIREFPQIIFFLGLMLYRSWQLFLMGSVVIFPVAYLISHFAKKKQKIDIEGQRQNGKLLGILTETILGIRIIKSFCTEKKESEKFGCENRKLLDNAKKAIRVTNVSTPLIEMVTFIIGVTVITVGIYFAINKIVTAGEVASFFVAFLLMYPSVRSINGFSLVLQSGIAGHQRIKEIMKLKHPIIEAVNYPINLPKFKGKIEIYVDRFSYGEGEQEVLKNIKVTVNKKQTVALVGKSGSGKSTFVNLIPRFFDVKSEMGAIRIDGYDIRKVNLRSLREQIAIVSQDTILFNDTVAENIGYGLKKYSRNEIIEAAIKANAHDFIMQLPDGYEHVVGEKGELLSAGQKQRISIARALIKNASILILDEATSSLDSESEKAVQQALDILMEDRTTIVIAHRLYTIQNAHVIYAFENGKIVETGKHEQLVQRNGVYTKLYNLQFKYT